MPDFPGTIGRFEVLEIVGRGGMGVLYRARDPLLDRQVALKLLRDFPLHTPTREGLAREARAAARLQHRNIVTIHEFGEAGGVPYIAMEFLGGRDLEASIRDVQAWTVRQKLEIAIQLCEALGYAHERGIIHRDIKPGNVRVLEDGTVKVLDFGIARFTLTTKTDHAGIVGTVGYMAPEQTSGQAVDGRADLFSVGALLYELFSGTPAFNTGTSVQVLYNVLHATPRPMNQIVSGLPAALDRIVSRALEKDAAKRYGRAQEMADDLRRVAQGLTGAVSSSPAHQRLELPKPSAEPAALSAESAARVRTRKVRTAALWVVTSVAVAAMVFIVLAPVTDGPKTDADTAKVTATRGGGPPVRDVATAVVTVLDETRAERTKAADSLADRYKSRAQTTQASPDGAGGTPVASQPLEKITDVQPVYPQAAVAANIEGRVVLDITVGPDGTVADPVVVQSVQMLDEAAVQAVSRWRYRPPIRDGKPASVHLRIGIDFSLH